jgi:hypothetical protein
LSSFNFCKPVLEFLYFFAALMNSLPSAFWHSDSAAKIKSLDELVRYPRTFVCPWSANLRRVCMASSESWFVGGGWLIFWVDECWWTISWNVRVHGYCSIDADCRIRMISLRFSVGSNWWNFWWTWVAVFRSFRIRLDVLVIPFWKDFF